MGLLRVFLFASAAVAAASGAASAAPNVVVSIKPVHSLVAGVMAGVGEPALIVDGASSPHAFTLKPSQATAIEQADVIFWVGPALEAFLEKPVETLGGDARVIALMDAPGLARLPLRHGGAFEAHDYGDGDHDLHEADTGHDGENDQVAEAGHDHDHGAFDMHVWLDPENAKAMVEEIEAVLADADPANATAYKANAEALSARLDGLTAAIGETLAPVKERPFFGFHDGYQYFENRFDLVAAGSITVSPEVIPGAERVAEVRAKVKDLGATCVFAEPQFEPRLVSVVAEGTPSRSAVLDPLGAEIANGPDLYFILMRNRAASIRDCLAPES
jgi:zinc transport system substrate-binding protein